MAIQTQASRAPAQEPLKPGPSAPDSSPLVVQVGHSSAAVYLLRTVQQHHVHLSSMADNKANILIGATAVIFSLLVEHLHSRGFSLPVVVLLVFSLLAAAAAIMAVMPKVKGPSHGSQAYNPLFFGCFCQRTPEEYCKDMEKILSTDSSIYTAMSLDIYGLGTVLYRKKYRNLAYSYRILLAGLVAAFLTGIFTFRG